MRTFNWTVLVFLFGGWIFTTIELEDIRSKMLRITDNQISILDVVMKDQTNYMELQNVVGGMQKVFLKLEDAVKTNAMNINQELSYFELQQQELNVMDRRLTTLENKR